MNEIRAWKDEDYREIVPELIHPSGQVDLRSISAADGNSFNLTRILSWWFCGPVRTEHPDVPAE
ncbi:hypothetical protein [Nonomuraea pusilla]|uniref:hypothetical protein n=1 Tax=Nonomuraea pusilla TaxID=46177 RepID=UPI00331C58E6